MSRLRVNYQDARDYATRQTCPILGQGLSISAPTGVSPGCIPPNSLITADSARPASPDHVCQPRQGNP